MKSPAKSVKLASEKPRICARHRIPQSHASVACLSQPHRRRAAPPLQHRLPPPSPTTSPTDPMPAGPLRARVCVCGGLQAVFLRRLLGPTNLQTAAFARICRAANTLTLEKNKCLEGGLALAAEAATGQGREARLTRTHRVVVRLFSTARMRQFHAAIAESSMPRAAASTRVVVAPGHGEREQKACASAGPATPCARCSCSLSTIKGATGERVSERWKTLRVGGGSRGSNMHLDRASRAGQRPALSQRHRPSAQTQVAPASPVVPVRTRFGPTQQLAAQIKPGVECLDRRAQAADGNREAEGARSGSQHGESSETAKLKKQRSGRDLV